MRHAGGIHSNNPCGFRRTPPVIIVDMIAKLVREYPFRHPLKVWRDPSDRISALRIVTLMCLFAPLGKMIYESDAIRLDARPITELIHRTGDWALIFLVVALAVRPLSRILRYNQLLDVRRMIGVGAFAYAAAHFTLYAVDQMFDWREIASEIVHRNRLTLSFVALLGLTALTATSTNGMVRRLGSKRWQRLHQVIYLIGLLVLIHYFLRFKLIESTPVFATGLFGWLIGCVPLAIAAVKSDKLRPSQDCARTATTEARSAPANLPTEGDPRGRARLRVSRDHAAGPTCAAKPH